MMLPTAAAVTTRRRALGPRFGAGGGVGMSEASPRFPTAQWRGRNRDFRPRAPFRRGLCYSRMGDNDLPPPNRPSPGSGSLTVHLPPQLGVYFNEVAPGRPLGVVATPQRKPPPP